jgi:putative inorganic carbon (hco3(-)) transporter
MTAIHSIYKNHQLPVLLIMAVLVYAFLLALSWMVNMTLLPLAALLIIPVAYFGLKSLNKPLLWLFLIIGGSYAGNALHLFEGFTVPISLFQLFFLSGLFLLVLNRIYTGQFNFRLSGLELELSLFSALMFLSIIYSPEPDDALLFAVRTVVTALLLYFILNVVEHKNELPVILAFVTVLGLGLAIFSIRDGLMNPEAAILSAVSGGAKLFSRASTTQTDPNVYATYFFLPIAFSSCIIVSKVKMSYRIVCAIFLVILVAGIASTFSRSSWVSVILMLVLIALIYRQVKLFVWLGIFGVIALILLPDLRITALNIIQRFTDIFAGSTDDSSRIRVVQMYAAVQMFIDTNMIGVGLRGYAVSILDFYSYQELIGIVLPHNVTYTVLAELGLIGIMLFLFIIYRLTRDSYLNIRYASDELSRVVATSLFVSLMAFFMFFQFIGGGLPDNNVWLIIGLVYATKHTLLSRAQDA